MQAETAMFGQALACQKPAPRCHPVQIVTQVITLWDVDLCTSPHIRTSAPDSSGKAGGIRHLSLGEYLLRVCGADLHCGFEQCAWRWMTICEATDIVWRGTGKERNLGMERVAGVHGWSFNYSGICTAGMASVQFEECA